MKAGRVILIGAGPGAADLLTLRAVRALAAADVVLYDALVDAEALAFAPRAQKFCVGKRGGKPSTAQTTIDALMLRAARAGKTVVRLKCGDPFVLGRGGEEILALGRAGIDVEVVPGISSAIAGPAAVGIPVTHRDASPGFLVLSAVPSTHYQRVLAGLAPGSVTVVLMMALGSRQEIARWLVEQRWPTTLPAAIVIDATLPTEQRWTGTLGELASTSADAFEGEARGLLVLGPVVSLAEAIGHATRGSAEGPRKTNETREETASWRMAQGY